MLPAQGVQGSLELLGTLTSRGWSCRADPFPLGNVDGQKEHILLQGSDEHRGRSSGKCWGAAGAGTSLGFLAFTQGCPHVWMQQLLEEPGSQGLGQGVCPWTQQRGFPVLCPTVPAHPSVVGGCFGISQPGSQSSSLVAAPPRWMRGCGTPGKVGGVQGSSCGMLCLVWRQQFPQGMGWVACEGEEGSCPFWGIQGASQCSWGTGRGHGMAGTGTPVP